MDMQDDVARLIDLGRYIEHDAGKERLYGNGGRSLRGAGARDGIRRNVGHEELVGADLEHRLLVVDGGDAWAGKHLCVALRLEKVEQRREAVGLQREPEDRAGR